MSTNTLLVLGGLALGAYLLLGRRPPATDVSGEPSTWQGVVAQLGTTWIKSQSSTA